MVFVKTEKVSRILDLTVFLGPSFQFYEGFQFYKRNKSKDHKE